MHISSADKKEKPWFLKALKTRRNPFFDKTVRKTGFIHMVREMRLELTRLLPHAPQTCLSTYSSTLAFNFRLLGYYNHTSRVCQVFYFFLAGCVESIIKCRRNRYGFSCIIFLSEGRRKEVKTLNGYSYLTLEQRREIERMYAEGERVVDIAARLKRSAAAIYEELKRGYTGEFDDYARPKYSADLAQATVQENFRRRGNRRGANC